MNQAMALGEDARYRLKRPDGQPAPSTKSSAPQPSKAPATAPPQEEEVSFRTIVEEVASERNLLFRATGKSHERGYPLFRVSQGVDGKGGVTVYLHDDIVWAQEKSDWVPISVEEMCQRATRA